MKKRIFKSFGMTLCISVLIFSTTCCSSRIKDNSGDLQSPTENAALTEILQPTHEVSPKANIEVNLTATPEAIPDETSKVILEATPEISLKSTPDNSPEVNLTGTPDVTPEAADEVTPNASPDEVLYKTDILTPTVDDVKNFIPENIIEGIPSTTYPEKEFSISPRRNETIQFNRFYYMDNRNLLNTFFWECNMDSYLKFTSCRLYKEQQDGTVKASKITWNSDADKIINLVEVDDNMFGIMSQWIDENNGDFYIIVCKWTFDADDNPTFLYGIHPNGKLFVNIRLEDYLVIDKINPKTYALGYTINYVGQDNDIAYFQYKDDSQDAVVYYDMKNNRFIKQIFTGYAVKGIIDDCYVGVSGQQLIIGSIPEGQKMTNAKGNTISIGKSDIQQVYNLPDNIGLCVSGKYVYMLTPKQYQRFIPGDDNWEMLADVSKITETIKGDLYLHGFIAKNNHTFSILWYADSGAGYYFDVYRVE